LEQQGGYAGRGRGGYIPRGRGRGAPPNSWTRGGGRGGAIVPHHRTFRIDNRSTKLSVKNVDELSKEGLREHFEVIALTDIYLLSELLHTILAMIDVLTKPFVVVFVLVS